MATVAKDFKVKSGLVVEGATATVNNYDVLTKKQEDQNYIVDLIGGTATPDNTPNTVVKRDAFGIFRASEIDLTDLVWSPEYRATTAGQIINDNGNLKVNAFNQNDLILRADNNVNIVTNNADINLQPDGNAKIWGNNIATESYVDTSVQNGVSDAESYASNLVSQEASDRNTAVADALSSANSYTDTAITNLNLAGTYDALGAAQTAENNAKAYTDQEVAALVDSAPAMLDTLNELAAAIADNPNYATDVTNLVATKADTTYVDSADTATLNNAKAYADGLAINYDASGSAQLAQSNAETYAAGLVNQEAVDRDSAITAAVNAINTDVIEEGTANLYFTNQRAIDAVGGTIGDAINLLTTSDIEEGSNLYFTDARAVSALEAVVPNFTEIDLNNIVTNVATQVSVPTASQVTAHEFDSAVYRSAEYTVKVAYGSHTELSKVMLTLDSSDNIAITEYAVVGTNGSASTITADVNAGNVRLRVTPANNNSVVTTFGTIIK